MSAQQINGITRITGECQRSAKVEIVDSEGVVVGQTTADVYGNFSTDIDLPDGAHKVRARCTAPSGRTIESDVIDLEISASADDAWNEAVSALRDVERERAEAAYVELVKARANGDNLEHAYGYAVLEAAGRSMNRFNCDVMLQREINELEERIAERSAQMFAMRCELTRQGY